MRKYVTGAAILVFLAQQFIGAGQESVPVHAKPLLGCWRNEDKDQHSLVQLQADKCLLFEKGRLQIFTVKYEPGKLVLRSMGKKAVWQFDVKENVLKLTMADAMHKLTLRKLDAVPPELELKPLKLAKVGEVPKATVQTIQEEMAKRLKVDQAVRLDPSRMKEMPQVDADNTAFLLQLVQELGWIDVARFGKEAWNAAFLITQHSGHLPLMLAVLPEVEKDFKAGRIEGQPYALIYDRVQLLTGGKQRYATQLGQNEKNEWVILPLENRAKVEDLRRELGLLPLAQYIAYFKKTNGVKEVKFQEDD
jgi:hypothetical protein